MNTAYAASPIITSFTSDTNGTNQYIQIPSGTTVTFTVVAPGATSYNWYIDTHLNATQHTATLVMPMTGYHSIGVMALNATGNSTRQYKTVVINQVTATQPVNPLNDSMYWDFENNILAAPDLLAILNFTPIIYTTFIGNVFYAMLWFLAAAMIWIRTEKITVIATLGYIIGGYAIGSIPSQYQLITQVILVGGGIFAALYIFSKEKR